MARTPNVEYGGLAFSNNVYIPLAPEIERMKPDTSLYEKMEGKIMGTTSPQRKKIFQNMMTAEHCRLSLDGKTVWEDFPRQFSCLRSARNLMLHDYDLGKVEGSFETVQKIMQRARTDGWATRLGMKFPIQVSDGQSLLNWSSFRSNSVFYSLKYDGVIDDDAFIDWVGACREKAIFTQMEYHVTSSRYDANHFLEVLLPKILRQVIISRSYRVFFTLTYDEGFFPDPRWEQVLRLFNYYHNSLSGVPQTGYYRKIFEDTVYDFAAKSQEVPKNYYGDVMNTEQIREIFAFVRQQHYPLFTDFYECNALKLGGKL